MEIPHDTPPAMGVATPPDSARGPAWTKWWLIALTILIAASWLSFGLHVSLPGITTTAGIPATSKQTAGPDTDRKTTPAAPEGGEIVEGPWGRLELVPITICPPAEFVGRLDEQVDQEAEWHFPGASRREVSDILDELDLPEKVRADLDARAEFNQSVDGYTIRPGKDIVLGLSKEVREKLYLILNDFPENKDQRNAFRFCGGSVDQWLDHGPVSPETKRLVAPLVYRHGTFLFFADGRTVAPMLPAAERASLVRALTHESTLLLKLQVSRQSDVDSLVRYWGRGGRGPEVRPIIESVSELPGEQSIDVTQLLPPFARQRIYTYPNPPATPPKVTHDCFWSALNFFSDPPEDRFGDSHKTFETFGEDYYRIEQNPQFGDLVLYTDWKDELVHAAVYLAADVVFTKNGYSTARPWMLLKLENMKDFYPRRGGLKVTFFRHKGM